MGDNAVKTGKRTAKIKEFFKGVKSEFKKIIWPSFRTVANNTGVVIAVSLLIGVIVFVLDFAFTTGFKAIFGI